MATQEVTGRTQEGIDDLRDEYYERDREKPFEMAYCLAKIPNQPADYDGPDRFCTLNRELGEIGSTVRCKHHGGAGNTDGLDKLANMSHGMKATLSNLIEDFDEKDQALYDWIMDDYPESYGIDFDEDPNAMYDLHRLAAEIVRAERGRGYLIAEGEVHEKEIRNDDGRVVIDNEGNVVTEKSEHYLAQMMHRQDKKITDLEKELGITRKEQKRQDSTDDAVEAIKGFAALGDAFIDRDEDYDPTETPWEDEEENDESG